MTNLVNNKQSYLIQAFELEYLRDKLSANGEIKKLISTYKKGFPEIPNTNSGEKWDKLNLEIKKDENPMAYDRIFSLNRYIKGKKKKILDFGFGQGALEDLFKKRGKDLDIVGIDMSSKSVKKAKLKFKDWNFFVGGISKIKRYRKYFDYVVCSEVLEHISPSSVLSTLKQFNSCLKPNGKLLISIPLNEELENLVKIGNNFNSHTRIYTPDIIKSELEISRFKLIKYEFLYAFNKNYLLKKLVARVFGQLFFKPNVMIVLSQKI